MARRSINRGGAFGLPLACALAAATAGGARAETDRVALSVEAGAPAWLESCLSEDKLNRSYRAAHAGEDSGSHPSSPVAVGVRAVEQKGREATLEIRARGSERDLGSRVLSVHSNDCGAVPDAVALVLVLLSRSAAAEPEARPAPEPVPATPAFDAERPPVFAAPPPPAEAPPLQLAAAAVASLVWGVLPNLALGLAVDADVTSAPWSLRLRAQLLLPQTRSVAEGSVSLLPFGFGVDGCFGSSSHGLPWLGLRGCAGPRVALIHASGRGFRLENRAPLETALYLGAALEASAQVARSTWVRLHVDGALALFRPRFVVEVAGLSEPSDVTGPRLFRGEAGLSVVQIF